MDTILNYLNTMFNNLPQTDDVLRAKEEISQMMEDKYQALMADGVSEHQAVGQVIAEFGDIEEIKETFGLMASDDNTRNARTPLIELDETQVNLFYENTMNAAMRIAFGVALIIVSVIPIVIVEMIGDFVTLPSFISGVTFIMLFAAVAVAVFTIISSAPLLDQYNRYQDCLIKINAVLKSEITEEHRAFKHVFTRGISTSVAMFILAVVPVVWTSTVWDNFEPAMAVAMPFMFLAVAAGVFQIIYLSHKSGWYDILLNQTDKQVKIKRGEEPKTENSKRLESIFWSMVTLVYLVISFTFGWGVSWIIWLVAGIAFGIFEEIGALKKHNKRNL